MRQMIRPRSGGVIRLHGPVSKAARAARTARLMSSVSPSATRARVSPVAGLGVSKVLPDAASDDCPLMNSCRGEGGHPVAASLPEPARGPGQRP